MLEWASAYRVLFSTCVNKKRKRWMDGTLRVSMSGTAALFDDGGSEIASEKLPGSTCLRASLPCPFVQSCCLPTGAAVLFRFPATRYSISEIRVQQCTVSCRLVQKASASSRASLCPSKRSSRRPGMHKSTASLNRVTCPHEQELGLCNCIHQAMLPPLQPRLSKPQAANTPETRGPAVHWHHSNPSALPCPEPYWSQITARPVSTRVLQKCNRKTPAARCR